MTIDGIAPHSKVTPDAETVRLGIGEEDPSAAKMQIDSARGLCSIHFSAAVAMAKLQLPVVQVYGVALTASARVWPSTSLKT